MNKVKSVIYYIRNKINNHMYIGSTVNYNNRWSRHRYHLNKGDHHNLHLLNSWRKNGSDNFEFSIIEYVINVENLIIIEQYWLDIIKPEYNKRLIAENNLGIKLSDEQKERRKKNANYKNRIISDETKKRMSQAGYKRKPMSDDTKKKMSNSKKGIIPKNLSNLHKKSRKKVFKYKNGIFIRVYVSISRASKVCGISQSGIYMCCHKKRMTAGGYSWSFNKNKNINSEIY